MGRRGNLKSEQCSHRTTTIRRTDIANDGRGNDAKSSNKSGSESELVKAYHGSGGC